MDEEVRYTLMWLAEGMTTAADEMFQAAPRSPCATCGHDRRDHVMPTTHHHGHATSPIHVERLQSSATVGTTNP
jgi:hypothetical protein